MTNQTLISATPAPNRRPLIIRALGQLITGFWLLLTWSIIWFTLGAVAWSAQKLFLAGYTLANHLFHNLP